MSEFKGTNGKWCVNQYLNIYSAAQRICSLEEVKFISDEEKKANALLISKAPEMLAMLGRCKEGFDKLNQPFITSDIEELIKSATEG